MTNKVTKPQSEAERIRNEWVDLQAFTGRNPHLCLIDGFDAGFKAAVEQAEELKCHYSCGVKYIAVDDLKALLEPPSTRQQIKDLLED